MIAISGLNGSVTFASGYTDIVDSWNAFLSSTPQDLTPLSPEGSHVELFSPDNAAGLLRGGEGTYTCKLEVPETANISGTISGSDDLLNPESWALRSQCEARDITPLTAEWRTFVAGLKSNSVEATFYIDDTEPLIVSGATADFALVVEGTLAGEKHYDNVKVNIHEVSCGVAADDIMRRTSIVGDVYGGSDNLIDAENLPLAGDSGAATFVAEGGRQYSGDILVTSVVCAVNRRESIGSIEVGFVFNGEVTAA